MHPCCTALPIRFSAQLASLLATTMAFRSPVARHAVGNEAQRHDALATDLMLAKKGGTGMRRCVIGQLYTAWLDEGV